MDVELINKMVADAEELLGPPGKRRHYGRILPEQLEAMKVLWDKGYNATQIAKALKTKRHGVAAYLKKEGLFKPARYENIVTRETRIKKEQTPAELKPGMACPCGIGMSEICSMHGPRVNA
jgi:hypothetical protein